jgi:DNA replication protein DnaC
MTEIDRLKEKLLNLRLKTMARELDNVLQYANKNNTHFLSILDRLIDLETDHRWQNAIKLRFQQSKLNEKITVDQFDFNHHKSRKDQKTQILNLFNLEFIKEHKDLILIGNPGTGKTFLAKSIAYAACNANVKVLFTTAIDMINHLIAAEADHSLLKKLHYPGFPWSSESLTLQGKGQRPWRKLMPIYVMWLINLYAIGQYVKHIYDF